MHLLSRFVILIACSSSLAKKNQAEGPLPHPRGVKLLPGVGVLRLPELPQAEAQLRSA